MPDPFKHESPAIKSATQASKAALAAALSGKTFDRAGNVTGQRETPSPAQASPPQPEPTQTVPAAPAAEPATPVPAEPPSAPETPSPEPAAPTVQGTVDLSSLSPEHIRFLASRGLKPDDPSTWAPVINRELAKRIEDGNKLAELLRPQAPESVSSPPSSPPPPEAVKLDPRAVEAHLEKAMGQDRDAQTWLSKWKSNSTELQRLGYAEGEIVPGGELDKLQQNIRTLEAVIRNPHIQNDPVALEDNTAQLNRARTDLQFQLGEARDRESRNERLGRLWGERVREYRGNIETQLQTQADEEARRHYWNDRMKREAEWLAGNWTRASGRVAAEKGVDPAELDRHSRVLSSAWNDGHIEWEEGKVISPETMEEFIAFAADDLKRTRDAHHRQQAAEYATLSQQRQPASVPGAAPPTDPHADRPTSFRRHIRQVGSLLAQNMRAPRA